MPPCSFSPCLRACQRAVSSAARVLRSWRAVLCVALSGFALAPAVQAQAPWPAKPVHVLIPYPAGTPPDITTRLYAEYLAPALGQPVVVENRPGATGLVALRELARQPADGYTLLHFALPLATAPALLPAQHVDVRKEIEPIMLTDLTSSVLVVSPGVNARSVKELVALMREQPGRYAFGSGGNGTPAHLVGEMFKRQQHVSAVHVPAGQFSQVIPDLASNRLQFMFLTSSIAVPNVKAGLVRGLAVVSGERLAALPSVPTMAEEGFGDFDPRTWGGYVARAGTPRSVIERLNSEFARIMKRPDVRQRLVQLGVEQASDTGTPQEFGRLIDSEIVRWGRLIRESGISVE